ncbi:MAG TPA: c-type cytochrome biogenesis protein CcmI [Burkholderiales bacterium]|nr:c-type cytochrome biogenesis protein CcmI [Burkholderiales bacterium]
MRELDADLAAGAIAQADYERARREIEARVLEDVAGAENRGQLPISRDRKVLITMAVAIPVLSLGVYFATGNPGAIDSPILNLETMVERLATRLKERPDDVEGWRLLGRSYMAMGRFGDAAEALARAAKMAPKNPDVLADLADVLAMMHGRRLQGEPEKLVLRALELDPNHLKALALAGTAAYDRKDYGAAAGYWQRMLPHLDPASEDARAVQSNIEEAKTLAAAKPLKGTVTLSAKLKAKASPEDTVFIFARAAEGPPAPLAVMRTQVKDLPVTFTLDDSMAMAPGMKLSAFRNVVVVARVSKSGEPQARAGDLQGASKPVANDASGVSIVIDSEVR